MNDMTGGLMEKVVYFLGAGFSAPLGLPVMTNFLAKSKDMYFQNQSRYARFPEVFNTIKRLSVSKNYYEADLFNIEEILSILEMRELLGKKAIKKSFIEYIKMVIRHFTPSIVGHREPLPANWSGFLFGNIREDTPAEVRIPALYGYFAANLLGLQFYRPDRKAIPVKIAYSKLHQPSVSYSIVTVNYDLVLENYAHYIKSTYDKSSSCSDPDIEFSGFLGSQGCFKDNPSIAKLHGSVDTSTIVPPTWNKAMGETVIPSWQLASRLLAEANHIRMVGFSLPVADTYIKYLLKAAVLDAEHLKSIDVLCLDHDGSVQQRYDQFIEFNKYRFVSGSVVDYLETLAGEQVTYGDPLITSLAMNKLEDAHNRFFDVKHDR